MKLLTKALLKALPPLRSTDGLGDNAKAIVKFFDPTGSWSWFATEFDPTTGMFFGLVSGFELEAGYFSLSELSAHRGRFGLGIERDLHFRPLTLGEIKAKKGLV